MDFFRRRKMDTSCRKLDKVRKEKASIAVQSGFFFFLTLSSDSSALRVAFFSRKPCILSSAEIVPQEKMQTEL